MHGGAAVGRPSKLDEHTTDKILEVLRVGGYVETAAQVAGVSRATFHAWMERGDPDGTKVADEPFREFRRRVDNARAEGEQASVALIRRAGVTDWKAVAWLLERQFPERWAGPRSRAANARIGEPDDPPGAGGGENPMGIVDDQVGPDGQPL